MDTKSALTLISLRKREGKERSFLEHLLCARLCHISGFPTESSYRTLQQSEDVIFLKENQNGMELEC